MLDENEVIARIRGLTRIRLERWVARGWIAPAEAPEGRRYSEIDIARCNLICQLRDDMGIERDVVPVILSLLDQVYGLRRQLRVLSRAISEQPDEVKHSIIAAIKRQAQSPGE